MRAVMPGYVNYFYKDGVTAANTKTFFTEHKILTVQSVIVKNALPTLYVQVKQISTTITTFFYMWNNPKKRTYGRVKLWNLYRVAIWKLLLQIS